MQQRITPKFLSENIGRKRALTPMHRLPQCHLGIRELSAKIYIKWINRTSHCHHRYPIARHILNVLKSNTQSNITKPQRARLNSSQEGRGGETPYDPTIITKSSQYIKIVPNQEHEREIKHIATHTYPQPRGWTTPSSSCRLPGWWRWPPVMISPSGKMSKRAPGCFFMAIEACGGGSSDLGFFLEVTRFINVFGADLTSRRCSRGPQAIGARP